MKRLYAVAASALCLAMTSCASAKTAAPDVRPQSEAPLAYARIGETIYVDGPKVTPLAVLEDSRCPANAHCVWAGQVRLRVRIDLGSGSQERELTSNTPIPVADGTLALIDVQPPRNSGQDEGWAATGTDYRFGFRFMGGL